MNSTIVQQSEVYLVYPDMKPEEIKVDTCSVIYLYSNKKEGKNSPGVYLIVHKGLVVRVINEGKDGYKSFVKNVGEDVASKLFVQQLSVEAKSSEIKYWMDDRDKSWYKIVL
jgi:hypothetical protein